MDKIWQSGAAVAAPPAPAGYGNGYPTAGDVGTSTPPTNPGAWWFHMITMEILNVITAAGVAPNGAAVNQLLAALDARYSQLSGDVRLANFTGSNQQMSANGWQKLPGGLILEWCGVTIGDVLAGTPVGTSFTYPLALTEVFLAGAMANGPSEGVSLFVHDITTTGAKVYSNEWNSAVQTTTARVLLIGR